MKMYFLIRKYLTSEFAGNEFWGHFYNFTELNLTNEQFSKLLDFFSSSEYYRAKLLEVYGPEQGRQYRYMASDSTNEVYTYGVLADINWIPKYIRNIPEYFDFVEKRDAWSSEIGWQFVDERIAEAELTFDEETLSWRPEPSTFEELTNLYNSGIQSVYDYKVPQTTPPSGN